MYATLWCHYVFFFFFGNLCLLPKVILNNIFLILQPCIFWQENLSGSQWGCSWWGMIWLSIDMYIYIYIHNPMPQWILSNASSLKKNPLCLFLLYCCSYRSSRAMSSKSWVGVTNKVSLWSRECWLLDVFVCCFTEASWSLILLSNI